MTTKDLSIQQISTKRAASLGDPMTALPGTIDEWEQIEPLRWARYVPVKDSPWGAREWSEADGIVTLREGLSFADYWAKREASDLPPRRIVPRRTIIERLAEAGLLDEAEAALLAAPALIRWKWNTAGEGVYFDDTETIAFLTAINADPDLILAP